MSNLSAFPYIAERSEGTPGLWNNVYSILSSNIAALNSDLTLSSPSGNTFSFLTNIEASGGAHFQFISVGSTPPSYITTAAITVRVNSNTSDYLYFTDSSAQRSNYVIGSRAGNTADGLNIWDASAGTLVASFSKQSSRFYSPVVGASFDVGGSDFNVRAFSAVGDGVADDTSAFVAAIAALPTAGGVVSMPSGTYKVTDTLNLSFASTGKQSITLRGAGIGATVINSTVTNKPGIISNDSLNQANILEGFDLFQSGRVLPTFRSGNYGIQNMGDNCPYLALRNLRVFYWGDVGIRLAGGNGPFSVQDVGVQSCASWGIHLVPDGSNIPEEVQIIGGNIQSCVGGLRLTGAASTGVYDIDIELGTVALYPCIQLDGSCVGGIFTDPSCSLQTVPTPAAIVCLKEAFGVLFASGQYLTAATNVDAIKIGTGLTNGSTRNMFLGGHYEVTGGGYYAQVTDGCKQNFFACSDRNLFAAGKDIVNNSSGSGDAILFMPWSGASDDHSLVLGTGNIAVGSGTALLPSINFGGTSEVSLGWYRSASSTIKQTYGTLAVSAFSQAGGTAVLKPTGGGVFIQEDGTGNVGAALRILSNAGASWWAMGMCGAAGSNSTHLFFSSNNQSAWANILRMTVEGQLLANTGSAILPTYAMSSESSLGFYRSGVSTMGLSYGALAYPDGSNTTPSIGFSSNSSLGLYSSGVQTIAQSYGTFDLTAAIASIGTLRVKSGANNSCGTAVLGSNGSVNVANTYVKTGDLIFLTDQSPGGTLGDLEIGGIRNSSGFTILSTSLTDTSTVAWLIIRPG